MPTTLFVYGTLMYPDLFQQVCGQWPQYEAALLPGFCPRRLIDRSYPGLIPCPGYQTHGLLLYDLDEAIIARLDAYEGEEYERQTVEIICKKEGLIAQVYVLHPAFYTLLTEEIWQPEKEQG